MLTRPAEPCWQEQPQETRVSHCVDAGFPRCRRPSAYSVVGIWWYEPHAELARARRLWSHGRNYSHSLGHALRTHASCWALPWRSSVPSGHKVLGKIAVSGPWRDHMVAQLTNTVPEYWEGAETHLRRVASTISGIRCLAFGPRTPWSLPHRNHAPSHSCTAMNISHLLSICLRVSHQYTASPCNMLAHRASEVGRKNES